MFNPFVIIGAFTNLFVLMFKMMFEILRLVFQIVGYIFKILFGKKNNVDVESSNTTSNIQSPINTENVIKERKDNISAETTNASVKNLRSNLVNCESEKNHLVNKLQQCEDNLINEIEKQKKLLDHNAIDNDEYKRRIDTVSNQLSEIKNSIEEKNSQIKNLIELNEKVKLIEDEVNTKFDKQRKCLALNLISKAEYEKEKAVIQEEMSKKIGLLEI